jgi:hypothetical protein
MLPVENFFLTKRDHPHFLCESFGDFLLKPARIVFGGRCVSPTVEKFISRPENDRRERTWKHVVSTIIALVLLPFSLLGALIKLPTLREREYRNILEKIPFFVGEYIWPKQAYTSDQVDNFLVYCTKPDETGQYVFMPLMLQGRKGSDFNVSGESIKDDVIVGSLRSVPDKNQPLRLLSLKTDGLLLDFIMLEELVAKGFTNISIDFVGEGLVFSEFNRIQQYFAKKLKSLVELACYRSISEIPKDRTSLPYHACLAANYHGLFHANREKRLQATTELAQAFSASMKFHLHFCEKDDVLLEGQSLIMKEIVTSDENLLKLVQNMLETLGSNINEREMKSESRLKVFSIGLPSKKMESFDCWFILALVTILETYKEYYPHIQFSFCDQEPLSSHDRNEVEPFFRKLFTNAPEITDQIPSAYDLLLTYLSRLSAPHYNIQQIDRVYFVSCDQTSSSLLQYDSQRVGSFKVVLGSNLGQD